MNHPPEPWKEDGWAVVDASGEAVIPHDAGVTGEVRMRIVASVNFCQHLPTELIQQLTAAGIGPATLAQWVQKNPTFQGDNDSGPFGDKFADCIQCDHNLLNSGHQENCLLEKFLQLAKLWH